MAKIITFRRLKTYWPLYAYILPSAVMVILFRYYPCASAIYHSMFRWNGYNVEDFIGIQNFHRIFGWSPLLWVIYGGWTCLLMMTLTGRPKFMQGKAAIGLLGLAWLVGAALKFRGGPDGTARVFNLVAGDALAWYPVTLIACTAGVALHLVTSARWARIISSVCLLYAFLHFFDRSMVATGDPTLWKGFAVIFILVVANIFKMIPSIATAVVIHRIVSEKAQYIYRVLFVVPMIIPQMVYLLIWKYFFEPTGGALNKILHWSGGMDLLVYMDKMMNWGVFNAGQNPAWLGNVHLIIPSLIMWGFPWVGVVGVLIYLAGLSSIGKELYEASDIDGINWLQKFFYIELPLIMTQVRINLILMIIGTLQGYGFILILLGDGGGPQGVALVPGLYMFRNAFVEGYAGYACALGLVLFIFILLLTEINNRYVRVEK